jgi:uncharacterized protein YqeY
VGDGTLKARLAEELRAALRARHRVRLSALRLLSAAVKNREVELRRELTDEEFLEVVGREVKRRREAIEAYEAAGRPDRAGQEREELEVLQGFLPPPLTGAEVETLIEEAIEATRAAGPADLGRVMGYVMGRVRGRADGRDVQARVRDRLASLAGREEPHPPPGGPPSP